MVPGTLGMKVVSLPLRISVHNSVVRPSSLTTSCTNYSTGGFEQTPRVGCATVRANCVQLGLCSRLGPLSITGPILCKAPPTVTNPHSPLPYAHSTEWYRVGKLVVPRQCFWNPRPMLLFPAMGHCSPWHPFFPCLVFGFPVQAVSPSNLNQIR